MKARSLSTFLALFVAAFTRADTLRDSFLNPPDSVRPGVYWYFMDGNQTREGMTADLEAMHRAGLRKALFLEVNIGVPKGPVEFMTDEWKDNFVHAMHEADRLGIGIILGTGPGWAGAGGPWITPERSMQHLRSSAVDVEGPGPFTAKLPVPAPRKPAAFAGLSPELAKVRDAWHQDVCVLAFPQTAPAEPTGDLDLKSLAETQPYSSWKQVPRFIRDKTEQAEPGTAAAIDPAKILDLTDKLRPDGSLDWQVPPGRWTVMRFAARNNSVTTRPAPERGHGFETDRFDPKGFVDQFEQFQKPLLEKIGPRRPGRGLTALHLDSWESSSQNWSAGFREEFRKRRGYDPQPYFPAYSGRVVGSRAITERFLWDLRKTSAELVLEHHARAIREVSHRNGLAYTAEFYDMNPAGDLDLGATADIPQCEFWTDKVDTEYSCVEAAAIANTMGRKVVRAEAFTSPPGRGFRDSPPDLKNQTDWALAMGVNEFIFHTWQHQPLGVDAPKPGMAMGPYGLHWHRNQTFWPMVGAYHDYLARCGAALQQGEAVQDILYLTPEGAPHIFLPPEDALIGQGRLRDKHGHGFDAVSPSILLERAVVENGLIRFPGGSAYRVLVLPLVETMTPELLTGITRLIRSGATVIGTPPTRSPSLAGYPDCDKTVAALAKGLWRENPSDAGIKDLRIGQGRLLCGEDLTQSGSKDLLYPSYASTSAWLVRENVPPVFSSAGPLRHHARRTAEQDVFFVSNRTGTAVDTEAVFRTDGSHPEAWDTVSTTSHTLPELRRENGTVTLPVRLDAWQSALIVFDRSAKPEAKPVSENAAKEDALSIGDQGWEVRFDPALGGPSAPLKWDKLIAWNEQPEPAVRYYSGEAVYRTSFEFSVSQKPSVASIDLGVVHKMARVKLNGTDLGITWTPPYRLDARGALRQGRNEIEITVVNTWVNRLIGDQQPADKAVRTLQWKNGLLGGKPYPAGRYTFSTVSNYKADSPLQESGLLGPVRLHVMKPGEGGSR